MEVIKFSNKQQAKTYTIFTIISVFVGIFVFSCLDKQFISSGVAYLIVTVLSSISLFFSMRKASKTFEEIILDKHVVSFNFSNKLKSKVIKNISDINLLEINGVIEIKEKLSNILIGRAYKNRIEDIEKWNLLISLLKDNQIK